MDDPIRFLSSVGPAGRWRGWLARRKRPECWLAPACWRWRSGERPRRRGTWSGRSDSPGRWRSFRWPSHSHAGGFRSCRQLRRFRRGSKTRFSSHKRSRLPQRSRWHRRWSRAWNVRKLAIPPQATRPHSGTTMGAWPLVVWLAGTLAVLAWCAIGWATVWRIGRGAERITDRRWVDATSEAAERLGMTGRVTLLRGGPAAMPVTWGDAPLGNPPAGRGRRVARRSPTGRPDARAGARPPPRRPDPMARPDGLRGVLVQPARVVGGVAAPVRARAGVRRPRAGGGRAAVRLRGAAPRRRAVAPPRAGLVPAAMAMARPSGLERRLMAILNARRIRRGPARWLVAACLAVVLGVGDPRGGPARGPRNTSAP